MNTIVAADNVRIQGMLIEKKKEDYAYYHSHIGAAVTEYAKVIKRLRCRIG